jgi:hypothetical protein
MNSLHICALPICFALLSQDSWAGLIIQWVLNPAILVIVPLVTLGLTIRIVKITFDAGDNNVFIRVLAAALLPFITVVFIFVYQETFFSSIAGDLPRFSHPAITGVSRFWFASEYSPS